MRASLALQENNHIIGEAAKLLVPVSDYFKSNHDAFVLDF